MRSKPFLILYSPVLIRFYDCPLFQIETCFRIMCCDTRDIYQNPADPFGNIYPFKIRFLLMTIEYGDKTTVVSSVSSFCRESSVKGYDEGYRVQMAVLFERLESREYFPEIPYIYSRCNLCFIGEGTTLESTIRTLSHELWIIVC